MKVITSQRKHNFFFRKWYLSILHRAQNICCTRHINNMCLLYTGDRNYIQCIYNDDGDTTTFLCIIIIKEKKYIYNYLTLLIIIWFITCLQTIFILYGIYKIKKVIYGNYWGTVRLFAHFFNMHSLEVYGKIVLNWLNVGCASYVAEATNGIYNIHIHTFILTYTYI